MPYPINHYIAVAVDVGIDLVVDVDVDVKKVKGDTIPKCIILFSSN